jgi:hypothetical protein
LKIRREDDQIAIVPDSLEKKYGFDVRKTALQFPNFCPYGPITRPNLWKG